MSDGQYPIEIPVTTPGANEASDQLEKVAASGKKVHENAEGLKPQLNELGAKFKEAGKSITEMAEGGVSATSGLQSLTGAVTGIIAGLVSLATSSLASGAAIHAQEAATLLLSKTEIDRLKVQEAGRVAAAESYIATVAEANALLLEAKAAEVDVVSIATLAAAKRQLTIASGQMGKAQAEAKAATASLKAAQELTTTVIKEGTGATEGAVVGLGSMVGAASVLAASIGAVTATITLWAAKNQEAAFENSLLAEKLGLTATGLGIMKVAAEENGGSVDGMVRVLDKFSKSLAGLDDENKKTTKSFETLGLSAEDFIGKSREEAVAEIIKKWRDMGETVQGTAAVMNLLGRGFRDQIPALLALGEEHDKYLEKLIHFNATATEDVIKAGKKQKEASSDLGLALTGLGNVIGETFGGMTTQVTKWLAELTKSTADSVVKIKANITDMLNFENSSGSTFTAMLARMTLGSSIAGKLGLLPPPGQSVGDKAVADRNAASEEAAKADMEKEKKKNKFTPTTPTADTGTAERDVYAETIEALIKMNQLEGQSTEVAKAGYEIRRGFAAEWNATQKATYLITAQIVDDTKAKIKEETEASAALVKQASDELKMRQQQADIVKKAKGDIAESATKSGAAIDLERATLGLTAIEKDLYLKMADIDSLVRKRVETLDKGSTTYADDIAEISKAAEKAKKDLTDLSNIKHEFDTSWANGAQQAFAAYADSADNAAKQSKDGILSAFSAMEQGLVNFATGVKTSWADMAKAILLDLEKIIAKQAVAGLVGGLGSLFKSKNSGGGPEGTASFIGPPSDLAASAMGNVFDTGGLVTAFASGGVISQPTMFGMGSGGLGIAGEAGPEAIMPLSRGPDGKLGVSVATSGGSSSGGTTIGSISIVVNESKSAKDTANEVSSKIQAEIMRNQMKSLLVDEKRPGGILSKG